MSQYLIALWDYEAAGEFELSFKQGDRIKLLEKHNDDWWEGELNDVIGFFPVNRIRLESDDNNTNALENTHETINVPNPSSSTKTIDNHVLTPDNTLPEGWEHAYDEDGTIYYFNEATGESSWDMPISSDVPREDIDSLVQGLTPDEMKKLEFGQLQTEWIRFKGYIQMKMISEKEDGGKLSSWKSYYAILSNGFLLLYKEAHVKSKKSSRSHIPVGSFDLESCKIDPASKTVTRRKNVFIISTPKKVRIYIQTMSEKEFSGWLDAIMRELIARKERQNDESEIMRLLKSLCLDDNHMKINRKMVMDRPDDKRNRSHWFSSKSHKSMPKIEPKFVYGQQQPSDENDIFGGYLRVEENGDIPYIVAVCIDEVERRGLESVGIYRLSGPAAVIQKYRTSFNLKEAVSLEDEQDINAVTGLLKLYFRELRNPLMTYEYYDYFIEAARISDYDEFMYRIKSIIHSLPSVNYATLERLMRHLHLVASYSEVNKMEASNLALIFSVGLLRSAQENFSGIMMADLQSKIIEAIIQQVDWFFEEEDIEDESK